MSEYTIYVCYDGNNYKLTDEGNADVTNTKTCHKGTTVKWVIGKGPDPGYECPDCTDLVVEFQDGSLFDSKHAPPHGNDPANGTQYTFDKNPPKPPYEYSVSVKYRGRQVPAKDPEIAFDEGSIETHLQALDEATLTQLGNAAQTAFQGLITNLKAAQVQRDPNGLLFPGGINSIAVQASVPVGLAAISVSLTVSGSDPIALFAPPAAKK